MDKDPFTHRIIGLAMATHRELGPGLREEFYHQSLVSKLVAGGIEHLSKPRQEFFYRGYLADTFEADLVFPGKLIADLKVLRSEFDSEHYVQILSYSKYWRIRNSLLFDFGKPSLFSKRIIYTSRTAEFSNDAIPSFVTNPDLARTLISIARRCLQEIGCGFRPSTWVGVVSAGMQAEGLTFVPNPTALLQGLGAATMKCLAIENQTAIAISALGREVTAMDRAWLQTCLKWLKFPWGICFHFGKDSGDIKFVSAPNAGKDSNALAPDSEHSQEKQSSPVDQ